MAISITRYVDITSGIGAATQFANRQYIARMFTINPLVPTESFLTFNNANDVSTWFGTNSEEYARALNYFIFISKLITTPQSMSFARWTNADTTPLIYGNKQTQLLATWTAITSGSFGLTIGAEVNMFSSLDFSAALSLADVATILQTAIRTGTGTQWTAATVSYDAIRSSFNLVGGATGVAEISVQEGTSGTHIGNIIGWLSGPTLIISDGDITQSITNTLTNSANASDNFGSFLFLNSASLNLAQITEGATWNEGQNVKFIYHVGVSAANAASYSAALIGIGGIAVTLSPLSTKFPEQLPMSVQAATNYNALNSAQNYMFQQTDDLTPSVTDDIDANFYDKLRINYYGQTQSAGQLISFYQTGVMMGGATDPLALNIYANEIWLKDTSTITLMNLQLALSQLPANTAGVALVTTALQGPINTGLSNGTISVGKTLTTAQQLYISEITGDINAWYQVQNIGYWLGVQIVQYVVDSITKYKAVYTLVYSKDDTINLIEGSHVLI